MPPRPAHRDRLPLTHIAAPRSRAARLLALAALCALHASSARAQPAESLPSPPPSTAPESPETATAFLRRAHAAYATAPIAERLTFELHRPPPPPRLTPPAPNTTNTAPRRRPPAPRPQRSVITLRLTPPPAPTESTPDQRTPRMRLDLGRLVIARTADELIAINRGDATTALRLHATHDADDFQALLAAVTTSIPALALASDPTFAHPLGRLTPAPIFWHLATPLDSEYRQGSIVLRGTLSETPPLPGTFAPFLAVFDPATARLREFTAHLDSPQSLDPSPPSEPTDPAAPPPGPRLEIRVQPIDAAANDPSTRTPDLTGRRLVRRLEELAAHEPLRTGEAIPTFQLVARDFSEVQLPALLTASRADHTALLAWPVPVDPETATLAEADAQSALTRARKALEAAAPGQRIPIYIVLVMDPADTEPQRVARLQTRWRTFPAVADALWTTDELPLARPATFGGLTTPRLLLLARDRTILSLADLSPIPTLPEFDADSPDSQPNPQSEPQPEPAAPDAPPDLTLEAQLREALTPKPSPPPRSEP